MTKTGPGWWGSCCLHGALEAGPPEGLPSRTEGGKAGWWACSHCSHTGPYLVSCFAVAILKFFLKKRLCTGPPRLCSQSWGRGKQGGVLYSRIPSNKWRRADTARKSPCCIQDLIHAEIVIGYESHGGKAGKNENILRVSESLHALQRGNGFSFH